MNASVVIELETHAWNHVGANQIDSDADKAPSIRVRDRVRIRGLDLLSPIRSLGLDSNPNGSVVRICLISLFRVVSLVENNVKVNSSVS